ncbi:hypothetical protein HCJ57_15610 [Listeria booriae]|uniref:Replication-associated protein n=1 Tax=Listeria booriae TaxID=1552123 RepID=A0A7X0WGN4_9LIST|nr:hypothetical protein [Listeria booriae]MBC1333508.1 hypothetical protein [Listeria booriae]MBC1618012.1 hypothetical protein [Listeria booriae]MBC2057952.1 hypothetical protein [Listeria booriae]MBC2174834.1 hypothetical protein [Listeria booriae]
MSEKKPGFFNKDDGSKRKPNGNVLDLSYKPTVEPRNPDKPQDVSSSIYVPKNDARKTMRVPEEQFFEFMALLEVSEYSYTYELLGEMINSRMNDLDSADMRLYNGALESIKRTEMKKKQRKK